MSAGSERSGVLKGDLKGWERVVAAVSRRRRLEDRMGDMVGIEERLLGFGWQKDGMCQCMY